MSVYYVTHPNLGISGLVHAPTTEKARTTFLDWLERTGKLSRSRRQSLRRNMVAEKMEDSGGIDADVELHYGYASEPESVMRLGFEEEPEVLEGEWSEVGEGEVTDVPIGEFEEKPQPKVTMPIQKLALGIQ